MLNNRNIANIFLSASLAVLICGTSMARRPTETAVLAGGCYWGMESVFEHVKGVSDVTSGFAGGVKVGFGRSNERSGFAEAVRIRFDPTQITYQQLLEIYFRVAHDPTQVDRQGPDIGPRYRSAIFPANAEQRRIALEKLSRMKAANGSSTQIATRVEAGPFWAADADQQDYVRKHPKARYVIVNDLPKLRTLKAKYPQYWLD